MSTNLRRIFRLKNSPPSSLILLQYMGSLKELGIGDLEQAGLHGLKSCSLQVLEKGWPIYGSNLQTLNLWLPPAKMSLVMKEVPKLPRLEKLSISVQNFHQTSSEPNLPLSQVIATFINHHHDTLRALSLHSELTSPILPCLRYMPHLESFTVFQRFSYNVDLFKLPHKKFLKAQCSALQHLDLQFAYPETDDPDFEYKWIAQGLRWINFPRLKTLKLGSNSPMSYYRGRPRAYCLASSDGPATWLLERFIHDLTHLRFESFYFRYDSVLSVFAGVQSRSRMRILSLHVCYMSPDILRLFPDNLPFLEELQLDALGIRAVKDIDSTRSFDDEVDEVSSIVVHFKKYSCILTFILLCPSVLSGHGTQDIPQVEYLFPSSFTSI